MTLDLDAIKARCEALNERIGKGSWTLEGGHQYGLFSVYDNSGDVVSHGVKEEQDFIAHSRADVPALVAEVERLQRELHDEQARCSEREKMCNQAPGALPCGHPRSAVRGDGMTHWCATCEEATNDRT